MNESFDSVCRHPLLITKCHFLLGQGPDSEFSAELPLGVGDGWEGCFRGIFAGPNESVSVIAAAAASSFCCCFCWLFCLFWLSFCCCCLLLLIILLLLLLSFFFLGGGDFLNIFYMDILDTGHG